MQWRSTASLLGFCLLLGVDGFCLSLGVDAGVPLAACTVRARCVVHRSNLCPCIHLQSGCSACGHELMPFLVSL
jgi:hypothetical protein